MAMRAPKTEATGTSGQTFVKAHFEQLGWGVMPNPEHDLGTDMVLQARDEAGFDLGVLLGVQVKSGRSNFKEPLVVDGEVSGWWFREDEDHFNYWLDYQAAHIVVLHNQETGIAYWAHITKDKVAVTGVGRKIFVPFHQTVDAGHSLELIRVAESKAHPPQWDGSAWDHDDQIRDDAKLRTAFVAPRLLGPHPNAPVADLTAEQAVGLAVQMRLDHIERLKVNFPLLDSSAASECEDWTWRLYGALLQWLKTGERVALDAIVSSASTSAERAAAAVCLSHAMLEDGDPAGALEVVDAALLVDDLTVSDGHWLKAHKARIAYELGDLDVARETALTVKRMDPSLLRDPTLRVLLGSASQIVFNLGDWSPESVADVVRGRDNIASLWRTQVLSSGLGRQVEETFREWAPGNGVTVGAADLAWPRFRSAMLLAGYAADSPEWGYAATVLARHQLLSSEDKDIPGWVFDLLRLSGADNDMRQVTSRLLDHGPVGSLVDAASELDLSMSTRTSLQASITLVEKAADLLPAAVCDRHARWALDVLGGTNDAPTRLKPRFYVIEGILKMLKELWRGVSEDTRDEVRAHIRCLPTVEDQLVAGSYSRLLGRMGDEAWSDDEIAELGARPYGDNFELTEAIERVRAARSPDFRSTLTTRIMAGDMRALESYGSVTDLPDDVAEGAIQSLAGRVREQTESARKGAFGMGGYDVLRALALLNVWHPDQADWLPAYGALDEPRMIPDYLEGALDFLADVVAHIDDVVRAGLRGPLEHIRDRESFPASFGGSAAGESVRGAATVALALLFPDAAGPEVLLRLVRGDVGERRAAVRILIAREDETALVGLAALSRDAEPGVRSLVAGGLARWLVTGIAREQSLLLIKDLLKEPGVEIGLAVAGALTPETESAGVRALADLLAQHPSTRVRTHATRVAGESGSS